MGSSAKGFNGIHRSAVEPTEKQHRLLKIGLKITMLAPHRSTGGVCPF